MKSFTNRFFLILAIVLNGLVANAQKIMSEGSLVYNMSVETGSKEPNIYDMLDGATTTIYIKGNQTRSERLSGLGSDITIHDSKTGTGVILRDYSGQKLMITLTKDNWEKGNKKYEGITYETAAETKVIAGYTCKKVIAKLQDGTFFTVYYSPDLRVANKEYDYPFKTLPGLALQYELQDAKMKLMYTLSKISFDPVSPSKFEIPKSGYRISTYEEIRKIK